MCIRDRYMSDLHIDQDMLDAHLDILRSFEPNGVGASDAIDTIPVSYTHLDVYKRQD